MAPVYSLRSAQVQAELNFSNDGSLLLLFSANQDKLIFFSMVHKKVLIELKIPSNRC